MKTEILMVVAWARGGDSGEWLFNEFQSYKIERVMEMDGGDGCMTVWIHLTSLSWTLEMVKTLNAMLYK